MTALLPAEESALNHALVELLRLSPAARLEAVSRLVESVQAETSAAVPRKTLQEFIGVWKDDPDADAMEDAILNSRHSVSKSHLEDWD